jgi:biopolymer transport protein ExbB
MLPGMWDTIAASFAQLMDRGGVVMWPLLALSVLGLAMALERAWFFARTNGPGRRHRVSRMASLLRAGETGKAKVLAEADGSVYGQVLSRVLTDGEVVTESAVVEAIESQRPRLERFLPTLSTIITAAPMLGILGTVLGIIASFELLGEGAGQAAVDPRAVSRGIAEALLTTAVGLIISLAVLFPYNALRAQVDRTLSRLESLGACALHRRGPGS